MILRHWIFLSMLRLINNLKFRKYWKINENTLNSMGGALSLGLKILSERVLAFFQPFKLLYSITYAEKLNVSTTYFVKGKSNGKHHLAFFCRSWLTNQHSLFSSYFLIHFYTLMQLLVFWEIIKLWRKHFENLKN